MAIINRQFTNKDTHCDKNSINGIKKQKKGIKEQLIVHLVHKISSEIAV